ncbi:hypothetical protein HN371_05570 [Candidatus Poribacteria bacterium]|jgi:hypothetical protein|nr:hypothetical protein [Candidatus Poribacteria bacterium]MBT5532649.1 hypothetical protein [Candidatus Poribacteria bacterium]MBT5711471.1 hypothetical protein [Candidatus Poribacteria bacterium]MBT7100931.1 hypothetical protein [Candidatus Poribacteria bacterium]MBT7805378.1 hypothetical protein [Candidatus Poribacteria bacterium]
MAEQTATSQTPKTKQELQAFLRRLDEFRERLAAEHGPFEDSVKVLAMTRERHDGR